MAEVTLSRSTLTGNSAVRHFLVPAAMAVAGSGLVALCAHAAIPLPFTPVPLSLAPWAVLFLGLVLGPQVAFASLFLYLAEGAGGLPVFSPHGLGGIAQLLGPTGGYLLSYPFAAALAGALYQGRSRPFLKGLIAAAAGSLVILLAGALWLKLLTHMDLNLIAAQAIVPFLPGDVLKVCLAAGAASAAGGFRNRRASANPLPDDETL